MGPAPSLVIQTDRTRLKQVLLNLLTNAIKYNKPGGSVHYSCTVEGEIIRFHIKDTGIGIRKEEMDEIFSPFTRLERSSEIVEGTGVGLAIVHQLVQLLGGRIHVEHPRGQHLYGASFMLKQMEERKPVKEKKICTLLNCESRLLRRETPAAPGRSGHRRRGGRRVLRMKPLPRLVLVDYPAPEIPPELLGDMMKTAKENNIAIVAVISQETQRAQALQEGFSATVTMPVTERAIMQLFESI